VPKKILLFLALSFFRLYFSFLGLSNFLKIRRPDDENHPVVRTIVTHGYDRSGRSGEGTAATGAGGRKPTAAAGSSGKGRHQPLGVLGMTLRAGHFFLVGTRPHDELKSMSAFFALKFVDGHPLSPPFRPEIM
jgi:hypothetical protein